MNDEFFEQVYAIVEEIPEGKVATYGLIARLMDHPRNSRLVGKAMRYANYYGNYPCHRVIHSDGSLVVGFDKQRELLESEGVIFKGDKVDMKQCLWKI